MIAAAAAEIDKVKAIVVLEPVLPEPRQSEVCESELAKVPFLSVLGDNFPVGQARDFTDRLNKLGGNAKTLSLPEAGIRGNGHTMMAERNNEEIADLIEQWISDQVAT